MPRGIVGLLIALLFTGLVPRLGAQDQQGALSPKEVQQIRDNNIHPDARIKLFLKFVQDRVDSLKHLEGDRDARHRDTQIGNKLQEFTHLCDEMQDNMDTYDANHADIRKSLKQVLKASEEWPSVLRSLPKSANYNYAVETAVESARSAQQEAKKLLAEQEIFFKAHPKLRHRNGAGPE